MKINSKLRHLVSLGMAFVTTCAASALVYAASPDVHVDQVGYLTGHEKVAMVSLQNAGEDFKIVDAATGNTVYTGKLSAGVRDDNSQDVIRRADFTDFNQAGTYKLIVGDADSYDFTIGDNVYAVPALQNWRSYTLTRSGNPFKDELTGLEVKSGHAQDAEAQVYFSDSLNNKGDKVDVTGGWYDAGDYGKYTTTGSLAAAELMLAYEANPDHFTEGQLFFPEGVKAERMPDALTEVKYELEFLKKMQRSDGSTFHKVAGAQWPGFDKSPDTDTQTRFLYSTCTSSTAMYGAAMAIAARTYSSFDQSFAKQCLENAEDVWDYLEVQKEPVYRVDDGQESGSGPYNKSTDTEERAWLAAELFKSTGDAKYEKYLQSQQKAVMTSVPGFFTWDNCKSLAQFAYATAPKADNNFKASVEKAFLSYADEIVAHIAKDGYECALNTNEYTWASTKNDLTKGDILLMANILSPKQVYVEGALDQIHYLFGRNALNRSFMTGCGDNPPEHPHNRIHESTGAYIPGLIVGGPNYVSGGDPDQTAYLASGNIPPAKAYIDVLSSWSTNEYAIDYCSAGIYALSYFMKADPAIKAADLKLTRVFPPLS